MFHTMLHMLYFVVCSLFTVLTHKRSHGTDKLARQCHTLLLHLQKIAIKVFRFSPQILKVSMLSRNSRLPLLPLLPILHDLFFFFFPVVSHLLFLLLSWIYPQFSFLDWSSETTLLSSVSKEVGLELKCVLVVPATDTWLNVTMSWQPKTASISLENKLFLLKPLVCFLFASLYWSIKYALSWCTSH